MKWVGNRSYYDQWEEMCEPGKVALLIIDQQNDFTHDDGYYSRRGWDVSMLQEITPNLNALAAAAREVGVPVFWSQNHIKQGFVSDAPVWLATHVRAGLESLDQEDFFTMEGTWGAEIYEQCDVADGDVVLPKLRSTVFHNTPLEGLLRAHGIETLVIAGQVTEGCVDNTIRGARDRRLLHGSGTRCGWFDQQGAPRACVEDVGRAHPESDGQRDRRVLGVWRRVTPEPSTRESPSPGEVAVAVDNLRISFPVGRRQWVRVVNDVSFTVRRGEALGIVGESGSGKTMTSLALLGLVPAPGTVEADRIEVSGVDVLRVSAREWPEIRGKKISMIFQDALSGLNPVRSVGSTLVEAIRRHQNVGSAEAKRIAIDTIDAVGIPDPEARFDVYPHQLSGGLRQRVMIALAIVNRPSVVIADEPTTALDATIQAQILELLEKLVTETGLILITHDLGVAAAICDRIAVMYAGRFVEVGPVDIVLSEPLHPYTAGLLDAVPRFEPERKPLVPIPGTPPPPAHLPPGCAFAPRCPRVTDRCRMERPELVASEQHPVACWNPVPA